MERKLEARLTMTSDCPDAVLLRRFLDGREISTDQSAWTRERLELHVNDCEVCQRSIERLVAGQESWEGTARQLAELDAMRQESLNQPSALRDLIDQEKDRSLQTVVNGDSQVEHDPLASMSLDFLQPTDQPDSRGRLGTYEILDVVGRGGMGLVLKAYDPSLRRIVAIKVMAPHLASSPVARKRFIREARAAAAVSHDHVVAIYAVEENHEPPFLVMQFVSGKTLQERMNSSGPLALAEVLRIGIQTAAGLAAAHAQGLVHRDIKPANILLENGVERVKITDFGLARAVDDVGMTRTGIVAGTPQFMAPEQANGEAIDIRSDLFSLGSVLYTLCTGRPPFRATTTMGLLKRICEETPRSVRELNPDVPAWLDTIMARLLKKNPADRYQSAKEVAEVLGNWLAHVQRPNTIPAPTSAVEQKEDLTNRANVTGQRKSIDDSPSLSRGVITTANSSFSGRHDYSTSIEFSGDLEKAFDFAMTTLKSKGFVVEQRTASRLRLTGIQPSLALGPSIRSAYSVEMHYVDGTLKLDAHLQTIPFLYRLVFAVTSLFAFVWYVLLFIVTNPKPFGFLFFTVIAIGGVFASVSFRNRQTLRQIFDSFLLSVARFAGERDVDFDIAKMAHPTSGSTASTPFAQPMLKQVFISVFSFIVALLLVVDVMMGGNKLIYLLSLAISSVGILLIALSIGRFWWQNRRSSAWQLIQLMNPHFRTLNPAMVNCLLLFAFAVAYCSWYQSKSRFDADKNAVPKIHSVEDLESLERQFNGLPRNDREYLVGHWRLRSRQYDGFIPLLEGPKSPAIIDVTDRELRVTSRRMKQLMAERLVPPAFAKDLADSNSALVCTTKISNPPTGRSDGMWIDLLLAAPTPKITAIDLSQATNFTDSDVPLLAAFKELTSLDLSNTRISDASFIGDGAIARLIDDGTLRNLTTLQLANVPISDKGLMKLAKLDKLTTLDLFLTHISDAGLAGLRTLGGLRNVEHLYLGRNAITDAGLKELADCRQLKTLDLVRTQVAGIGFRQLASLTKLQILNLAGNNVSDVGLKEIGDLTSLTSLNLFATLISDDGTHYLKKLTNLTTLNIARNRISDIGLQRLDSLKQLTEIELNDDQVTAAGVRHFEEALQHTRVSVKWKGGSISEPLPLKPTVADRQERVRNAATEKIEALGGGAFRKSDDPSMVPMLVARGVFRAVKDRLLLRLAAPFRQRPTHVDVVKADDQSILMTFERADTRNAE
jgi:serine/threonine-protein kinase